MSNRHTRLVCDSCGRDINWTTSTRCEHCDRDRDRWDLPRPTSEQGRLPDQPPMLRPLPEPPEPPAPAGPHHQLNQNLFVLPRLPTMLPELFPRREQEPSYDHGHYPPSAPHSRVCTPPPIAYRRDAQHSGGYDAAATERHNPYARPPQSWSEPRPRTNRWDGDHVTPTPQAEQERHYSGMHTLEPRQDGHYNQQITPPTPTPPERWSARSGYWRRTPPQQAPPHWRHQANRSASPRAPGEVHIDRSGEVHVETSGEVHVETSGEVHAETSGEDDILKNRVIWDDYGDKVDKDHRQYESLAKRYFDTKTSCDGCVNKHSNCQNTQQLNRCDECLKHKRRCVKNGRARIKRSLDGGGKVPRYSDQFNSRPRPGDDDDDRDADHRGNPGRHYHRVNSGGSRYQQVSGR